MEGLQQTVFQNFNSETPYNFCSKKLTNKHALFPKCITFYYTDRYQ